MRRATTSAARWPSNSATTSCPAPRSTATARRRCRPPGWRSTRSRPARATCSSPPASRPCRGSPKGTSDGWPDTQEPAVRRRRGAHRRAPPAGADEWHDPREDGMLPDVYIAMGQTAENVALLHRHQPRGAGPVGRAQPEPRRGGHQERLLRARDHAGDAARRHRRSARTTARGPAPPTRSSAS